MQDLLITHRGTVYPWQCDHMGHMNVMWYVNKFDEATWQFFGQIGLMPAYFRDSKRGMAAVDQHSIYLRELRAGDIITVRSRLLEVNPSSLLFEHIMVNDQTTEAAASTTLKGVHVDMETRKSCLFEETVFNGLRALISR